MIQSIFSNWNLIRVLRLVIGLAILVQGIMAKDAMFGIAGVVFTLTALFNIGCCGAGGCNTPTKKITETPKAIIYEEVV